MASDPAKNLPLNEHRARFAVSDDDEDEDANQTMLRVDNGLSADQMKGLSSTKRERAAVSRINNGISY